MNFIMFGQIFVTMIFVLTCIFGIFTYIKQNKEFGMK